MNPKLSLLIGVSWLLALSASGQKKGETISVRRFTYTSPITRQATRSVKELVAVSDPQADREQFRKTISYLYNLEQYDSICPLILERIKTVILLSPSSNDILDLLMQYPDVRFDYTIAALIPAQVSDKKYNFGLGNVLQVAKRIKGPYCRDRLQKLFNETRPNNIASTDGRKFYYEYEYYKKSILSALLRVGGVYGMNPILRYYFLDTTGISELSHKYKIAKTLIDGLELEIPQDPTLTYVIRATDRLSVDLGRLPDSLKVTIRSSKNHNAIVKTLQKKYLSRGTPVSVQGMLSLAELTTASTIDTAACAILVKYPLFADVNDLTPSQKTWLQKQFPAENAYNYQILDSLQFRSLKTFVNINLDAFNDSTSLRKQYDSLNRIVIQSISEDYQVDFNPDEKDTVRFKKRRSDSLFVNLTLVQEKVTEKLQGEFKKKAITGDPTIARIMVSASLSDKAILLYALLQNRQLLPDMRFSYANIDSNIAQLALIYRSKGTIKTKLSDDELELTPPVQKSVSAAIRESRVTAVSVTSRVLNINQGAYSEKITIKLSDGSARNLAISSQIPASWLHLLSLRPELLDLLGYSLTYHELVALAEARTVAREDLDMLRADPVRSISFLLAALNDKSVPTKYLSDILSRSNVSGIPKSYLKFVNKYADFEDIDHDPEFSIISFGDQNLIPAKSRPFYLDTLNKNGLLTAGSFIEHDSAAFATDAEMLSRPSLDFTRAFAYNKINTAIVNGAASLPDLRKNKWYEVYRHEPSHLDQKNALKAGFINGYSAQKRVEDNFMRYLGTSGFVQRSDVNALALRNVIFDSLLTKCIMTYQLDLKNGEKKHLVATQPVSPLLAKVLTHIRVIMAKDPHYISNNNIDIGLAGQTAANQIQNGIQNFYDELYGTLPTVRVLKSICGLHIDPADYFKPNLDDLGFLYQTTRGQQLLKEMLIYNELIGRADPQKISVYSPTEQFMSSLGQFVDTQNSTVDAQVTPQINSIGAQFADKVHVWDDSYVFFGATFSLQPSGSLTFAYPQFAQASTTNLFLVLFNLPALTQLKPFTIKP